MPVTQDRPTESATSSFVCPECGRTFSLERGLTRHMNYAHGAVDEEEKELLKELAKPLLEQANLLRAQLHNVDEERLEIMGRLSRLDAAINKLLPQPKKEKQKRRASADRVKEVREFLQKHSGDYPEGFTSTKIHRDMQVNGNAAIGKERVRYAVLQLHEEGVVRLDRVGPGGGKIYRVIGDE